MNNEFNSVSSGINSVVSICKTYLYAYCESVTLLRVSLQFFSIVKIAYNFDFWTEFEGFVQLYLNLFICHLPFLIYLHQYRIYGFQLLMYHVYCKEMDPSSSLYKVNCISFGIIAVNLF